jgi:acyl phosphate:glycerol-3-phosphate acyltransferase
VTTSGPLALGLALPALGPSLALGLALILAAFLGGAIPFGVLIARRRGVDIRAHGSGNIGATNVSRVLGARDGAVVLVLDALKGALPTAAALAAGASPRLVALTGFAAILGHCFSPFLRGRGGKGVATALGVFAVIAPALVGVAAAVFVVVLAATRVPALGSLAGSLAISIGLVLGGGGPYAALACATTALLVYTHRTNLAKLLAGRRSR